MKNLKNMHYFKLIDGVNILPQDHVLFINDHTQVTANDIKELSYYYLPLIKKLANKSVLLSVNDALWFSLWILLLDGVCSRLIFLPLEITDEQKKFFGQYAEIDIIFNDDYLQTFYKSNKPSVHTNIASTWPHIYESPVKTQWIIATSGTTNTPKLVEHDFSTLTHTVRANRSGQKFIWGMLYNIHRFAGLQVLIQCIATGTTLAFANNDESLNKQIIFFIENNINALSATPTMWRKILMQPDSPKLSLVQITLGGEIVDQSILNALSQRYQKAKIRHIYASTEAGVGFSVADKKAGFPASYIEEPPQGVNLQVDTSGTLYIKSAANAKRYLGNQSIQKNTENYINTGDKVKFFEGRYYFIGRDNGSINVGGNKVFPEEVETLLLEYTGIQMAMVSAKKSAITGSIVQATIVLNSNIENVKQFIIDLKQYCAISLEDYKRPAIFNIVENIDTSTTGKLKRV